MKQRGRSLALSSNGTPVDGVHRYGLHPPEAGHHKGRQVMCEMIFMGSDCVETIDTRHVFQYSPSHDSSCRPFVFFSSTCEKEDASLRPGRGTCPDWNLMKVI